MKKVLLVLCVVFLFSGMAYAESKDVKGASTVTKDSALKMANEQLNEVTAAPVAEPEGYSAPEDKAKSDKESTDKIAATDLDKLKTPSNKDKASVK